MSYRDYAINWAKEAGKIQKRYFRKRFEVNIKNEKINLVSEVDNKSEEKIIAEIQKNFPGHSILAEERGEILNKSNYKWIIDPLDGTVNYVHGLSIFGISIALAQNNNIIMGVIYFPISEDIYFAEKGSGAFLNGREISVAKTNKLSEALLSTGFPYDRHFNSNNNLEYFNKVFLKIQGIRRTGCVTYDLCNVARGSLDGFWELKLNPWDIAAGGLIVKEAGGKMLNLNAEEISTDAESVVAGNSQICRQIINTFVT